MTMRVARLFFLNLILFFGVSSQIFLVAQSTTGTGSNTAMAEDTTVPALIRFNGYLSDLNGKPLTGNVGVTFLLFKDAEGGSPLWMETQNIQPDKAGHYFVVLGSTTSHGLPEELFASGEARWLAVQIEGQPEQPRVLLVAVPYALKAKDAETFGGMPPSAFVLASPTNSGTAAPGNSNAPQGSVTASTSSNVTTTGGTLNALPLFTSSTNVQSSVITQTGTGAAAKVGIGIATPAAVLDVKGSETVRGVFSLPATGNATAAAGKNSQPFGLTASAFNSSTAVAVNQNFRWQAEPAGNNSANPRATLNLLYAAGANTPAETGLKIASSGQITFAPGQTFPGSGGTVTSVGLTAPSSDFTVSGSPISSSGTLGLNWNFVPTDANVANAIVKRDHNGSFVANNIEAVGSVEASTGYFGGSVGIGTLPPLASLQVNWRNQANSDTVLIGNSTTRGLQLRDTGPAMDLESIGVPLYVNSSTQQPTYFGTTVGIGTAAPQALLNLNYANQANGDTLLVGNNTSKGIQLRDTGTGADLESIGVPLYVNYATHQPIFLAPNGGGVSIGSNVSPSELPLYVGSVVETGGEVYSAVFESDVNIGGNLKTYGKKMFQIDHPLDPTNKYLNHAAIESSEVLNQYSGNVVIDSKGEARVEFPAWFAAINEDFRYQLTAIGTPGPDLYVAEEIRDSSFTIAGGKPGMKVSWQVTARRNDPYMKAHPMVVEQEKPAGERGRYTIPELYGAPKEQGILWPHPSEGAKR